MAKTDTRVLTAHVPVLLAEKVDQIAARLERSRGWIMKQALSAWIEQEEERTRLTRDATQSQIATSTPMSMSHRCCEPRRMVETTPTPVIDSVPNNQLYSSHRMLYGTIKSIL